MASSSGDLNWKFSGPDPNALPTQANALPTQATATFRTDKGTFSATVDIPPGILLTKEKLNTMAKEIFGTAIAAFWKTDVTTCLDVVMDGAQSQFQETRRD